MVLLRIHLSSFANLLLVKTTNNYQLTAHCTPGAILCVIPTTPRGDSKCILLSLQLMWLRIRVQILPKCNQQVAGPGREGVRP